MTKPFAPCSILLLSALLVACGGSDDSSGNSAQSASDSTVTAAPSASESGDGPAWSLRASGAESLDIEIEPRFGCSNDQIHILTMSQSPRFDLYLPASIEPGTYPLAQFDPNADPSFVDGHAVVSLTGAIVRGSGRSYGTFYSIPQAGEITIERMPAGPDEFFTASIRATLASRDNQAIDLAAELNLKTGGMMLMNCRF